MKVIDLLNKIANREEVPNKIKDNTGTILDFNNGHYAGNTLTVLNSVLGMEKLNDEIEIIEEEIEIIEENKPIEKINSASYIPKENKYIYDFSKEENKNVIYLRDKINEIIDKLNELKKESDR